MLVKIDRKTAKEITNVYNIAKACHPKLKGDNIFWNKEIHDYRVRIYNEIALLYRRVWENRFDPKNSIHITINETNDGMNVEFDKGFIAYLTELYPKAIEDDN